MRAVDWSQATFDETRTTNELLKEFRLNQNFMIETFKHKLKYKIILQVPIVPHLFSSLRHTRNGLYVPRIDHCTLEH
jgi:hypothetical protein